MASLMLLQLLWCHACAVHIGLVFIPSSEPPFFMHAISDLHSTFIVEGGLEDRSLPPPRLALLILTFAGFNRRPGEKGGRRF